MKKNFLGASRRSFTSFIHSGSGFPRFRYRSIPSLWWFRYATLLNHRRCGTLRAVTIPCAFLVLALISCNEKSAASANLSTIEEAAIAANNAVSAQSSEKSASAQSLNDGTKIDYDLSSMNANMVYAEVFNMMVEPELYDDKVIKMRGNFAVYPNSPTANGGTSYAVVISDATACCQQGIEFQYDFAENLPNEGDEITVTGVYVTAMLEGDIAYNFVRASSVEM